MSSSRRTYGCVTRATVIGMRRPAPSDLGLIGGATAVATVLTMIDGFVWIDWAFTTILLTAVALVVRMSWRVYRDAVRERRTAARLHALPATEAARHAVQAERRRLSRDIEACVRESLTTIVHLAQEAAAADDPTAGLRRAQAESQRANTELRRQLGLLHAEDPEEDLPRAVGRATPIRRFSTADYLVAGAVVAVAVVDLAAGFAFEGSSWSWAIPLTLGFAATVLLRRVAPVPAALMCAGLITLGTLLGSPVVDGFSFPLTVGILAWSLASRRTVQAWLALATLVGVALISRLLNEPANAPINAVLLTVAIVGGATVGHSRAARAAAQVSASVRRQEFQAAAAEAVRAERQQVARDLHDLVSHAVSVIAVQAGAAELSWPVNPAATRLAIDVVRSTAQQTLIELDDAIPGQGSVRHDLSELEALCDRMRSAGLSVILELQGTPPTGAVSTVYRVVQESLTNALRHAPGSRVLVRISTSPDQVRVEVADDGPGQSDRTRRGYGLEGLAERLRLAGGTLETRSGPNGFTVTAVLPSAPAPVGP